MTALGFHPRSLCPANDIILDKPGKASYETLSIFCISVPLETFSKIIDRPMPSRVSPLTCSALCSSSPEPMWLQPWSELRQCCLHPYSCGQGGPQSKAQGLHPLPRHQAGLLQFQPPHPFCPPQGEGHPQGPCGRDRLLPDWPVMPPSCPWHPQLLCP